MEFKTNWGTRTSNKEIISDTPHWMMEKKRWPEKAALAEWEAMLTTCQVADYKGFKGSVRLWINKKTARNREHETYKDGFAEEGGDRLKLPSASELDAMRRFAHTSAVDSTHAFFSNRSSVLDHHGGVVGLVEPTKVSESEMDESVEVGMRSTVPLHLASASFVGMLATEGFEHPFLMTILLGVGVS